MSVKKIPARTATFCDVCHREDSYLTKCLRCKQEYCLVCNGCVPGCIVAPKVCSRCSRDESVRELCEGYAEKIDSPRKERDAKIASLKKKPNWQATNAPNGGVQ